MHIQLPNDPADRATAVATACKRRLRKPANRNRHAPAGTLQTEIESLRKEEAALQEEVRQLRAAVQIYKDVVNRLAARAVAAGATYRAA